MERKRGKKGRKEKASLPLKLNQPLQVVEHFDPLLFFFYVKRCGIVLKSCCLSLDLSGVGELAGTEVGNMEGTVALKKNYSYHIRIR